VEAGPQHAHGHVSVLELGARLLALRRRTCGAVAAETQTQTQTHAVSVKAVDPAVVVDDPSNDFFGSVRVLPVGRCTMRTALSVVLTL